MIHGLRWAFCLLIFLLPIANVQLSAQTYYWVGGPGAWTDLTKWAACSGCAGGAFVQVPQSNNDVVIDANSGFGLVAAANRTITLPSLANSTCRDLSIIPSAANFRISGATRMDVYGNITLEAALPAQTLWTGNLFLFGTGAQSHALGNVRLYNATISIEPTGGQHTIDRYNSATILRINPNAAGSATFTTSFLGQTVNHQTGTTTFDCPVTGYTATSRLATFTSTGGTVIANQLFRANTFTISGGSNTFNAFTHLGTFTLSGNTTVVNFAPIVHEWTRLDAQTTNTATLNITNATITNLVHWFLYSPNTIFNATGSTLDFNVSASNFVAGGEQYHIVQFRRFANLRANDGNGTGNPNGTFNQLTFEAGFRTMAAATYNINANGTLTMLNGGLYNGDVGGTIMMPSLLSYNIGNSAQVNMQGACANKLYMRNIAFNFAATPTINADHIRMELVSATGAAAPYQAGANSYGIGTTGWNAGASAVDAPRTGRYLRWVGAVPADISNAAQYAAWHNPANWADGNLHPAALPNDLALGGECPPTMWDSVVFDNNSYVRVDSPFIETRSMTWLGAGNFRNQNYTANAALLEIFGSIEWSAPMSLLYNGVIKLRSRNTYHTIRSNGQSFPFRVAIETLSDTGHYTLLDNMRLPSTAAEFTLDLRRGGISTNTHTLETYRLCANNTTNVRRLDIAGSTINITGGYFAAATNATNTGRYCFEVNSAVNNLSISAANSHIHILQLGDANTTNMRTWIGSGHAFHNITYYGDRPWLWRQNAAGTNSYNEVVFRNSGTIYGYNGTRDSFHILRTHTIDPDAINTFSMQEAATTSAMVVDSAFFNGNVSFVRPIDYRNLMYLAPGHAYSLDAAATRRQLIRDGGRLDAEGNCTQTISISGGQFVSNTPQTADYLLLNNNSAGPALFTHSNTIELGTIVGWVGASAAPRNLYWYNQSAGANTAAWDDNRSWSLADGVMLDMNGGSDPNVGNCPPTRVDNVYFTDLSFDNAADVVNIALEPVRYAECADMIWSNSSSGGILQSASVNERINIYGSLQWSAGMTNNFMGDIYMRATTLGHTLRSNGIAFRRGLVFTGVGGEWTLQDELRVPTAIPSAYALYLQNGTLRTNDQTVRAFSFYSNYATARALFAGTSQFYIASGGIAVDMRGSLFTLDVSQADFSLTAATNQTTNFQFLTYPNAVYHNISFTHPSGRGRITGTNNTFNVLHLQNAGFLALTNCTVDSVLSLATAAANTFAIISPNNVFGTMQIAGNAFFQTNNRYLHLLELSPARTYTFTSGTTQHLANGAHFQAVGTGGGGEIFFNSSSTGAQAYIRKDSGQVCVDFIYMRDIWATGNGLSTETACLTALCDTAQISSLSPTFATSGRAIFQGGGNANDQGNNAGWDFTPYPPVPQLSLRSVPPFAVCTNEPYTAVFEIVGQFPIDVSYSLEYGGSTYQIDSFDVRPTQGSGTAADPYIWYVTFMPAPVGVTTIGADEIAVVRCFNNTALGLGENDAFVAPCLLPLEVLSFVASCHSQNAAQTDLYWRVTGSADVSAYAVEHSTDGIQYSPIAELPALLAKTDYYFTHATAADHAVNYYRLRQTNRDGTTDYSRIVAADCRQNQENSASLQLFPNPARDLLHLQFETNQTGTTRIEILDLLGKTLLRTEMEATIGANLFPLSLPAELASGLYFLRLSTPEGSTQQREFTLIR